MIVTPHHAARFWRMVNKSTDSGCWLWTGWKNASGHGRFDMDGKKVIAAHVSLSLAGRPRPSDLISLHGDTCESAACIRPDHLRWGTYADNAADRDRLGRREPPRGTAHGMAKLTADDVRAIRADSRPQRQIAAAYGITQAAVSAIRLRKLWKHV